MSKKPTGPETIFTFRAFKRPGGAMSRAIEATMIRETLEQCRLEFGGGAGGILTGTIRGPADPFTQERPAWGSWTYDPSAPP
jgi:hypothetical protein